MLSQVSQPFFFNSEIKSAMDFLGRTNPLKKIFVAKMYPSFFNPISSVEAAGRTLPSDKYLDPNFSLRNENKMYGEQDYKIRETKQ